MKKFILISLLCYFSNLYPQKFSELQGLEDQLGGTHLFYRIFSSYHDSLINLTENNIFHWNLQSGADTFFLSDHQRWYQYMNQIITVEDYEFWQNNPDLYIYCGSEGECPSGYITRYDGIMNVPTIGWIYNVEISKQNDSLLYANQYKSTDGGKTWDTEHPLSFLVVSIDKDNDSILYGYNEVGLIKSLDGGITYTLVDVNPSIDYDDRFYYDKNPQYLYRLTRTYSNNNLIISNNFGNAGSWEIKYSDSLMIYISADNSNEGQLFLASGNRIYYSQDYGNSFSLYRELDRQIVGIYKKPNSDKLYAATHYKIYEITGTGEAVIKYLPVPDELFAYYPTEIGTKWIYKINGYDWVTQSSYSYYETREVIKDTILGNGHNYKLLKVTDASNNIPPLTKYRFIKVDSSNGFVYFYENNTDHKFEDLTAERYDTFWVERPEWSFEGPVRVLESNNFNYWGLNYPRKNYYGGYPSDNVRYSLTKNIGLDYAQYNFSFLFETWYFQGFISNGIVYGDTTVVNVAEHPDKISSFSLYQNYPNPFNASTIISYSLPERSFVNIIIYNSLGEKISNLINEEKEAGMHQFNYSSENLSSGIYIYRMNAGEFSKSMKMIYLK